MSRPIAVVVVGTRPEAIKMAPVVASLRQLPHLETRLLATGQHGKMLEYGPTADIFTHPQSDYTRKLLDAVPSL